MFTAKMGLFETQELDDLDLLLYGQPDDDTDLESSEIICRCGQGRGRGVERTVPRLPEAAIHHRIALMESESSGLSGDTIAELRASSPSGSSQGSRRGRGRARILRDNAAALPQVGLQKHGEKKEDAIKPEPKTKKPEPVNIVQKALAGNWLQGEEFPTLAASNSSNTTERDKKRKPHFSEISEKITELQPEVKVDASKQEDENQVLTEESIEAGEDATGIEECNVNIEASSDSMLDTPRREDNVLTTELSPKINKNNFMKQSMLAFQKMLPDGFIVNKNFGSRRNRNNMNHAHTYRQKQHNYMDRFVINDDVPEYLKYEVTHEDIKKHRERTLRVPGVVKDKVSEWLTNQVVETKEHTARMFDAEESRPLKTDSGDNNENVIVKEPNHVRNEVAAEEYSGVIRPEAAEAIVEERAINKHCKYSNSSKSQVHEELAGKMTSSNSDSIQSQVESGHSVSTNSDKISTDNEIDDHQIKELTEEINELGNSFLNDLDSSKDENTCQNSVNVTTSNIYISDEESNLILDNIKSAAVAQEVNMDSSSSVSVDSNAACLSESDFVVKYQTRSNNEKQNRKARVKTNSSGASVETNNVWRLDGKTAIQVDGLNRKCVLSHLEEMVT